MPLRERAGRAGPIRVAGKAGHTRTLAADISGVRVRVGVPELPVAARIPVVARICQAAVVVDTPAAVDAASDESVSLSGALERQTPGRSYRPSLVPAPG